MAVPSFNYSRNPEWKSLILLRLEIQNVVRIKIDYKPYNNDHGEGYKARAIVDCCKERNQEDPEDEIVSLPDEREWVGESLLDCIVVRKIFPKPCEPHGGMTFDNQSVEHTDNRKPDQTALP